MCYCRLLILSFEIFTYYLKYEKYRQKFDESIFNVFLFFFIHLIFKRECFNIPKLKRWKT